MANQMDKVVGVFLDQAQAQQAIDALKSQGFNAQIADKSAIKAFASVGLADEVAKTYEARHNQGNSIVTVDAGNRGDEVLAAMLQNGADYVNIASGQGQTSGMSQNTKTSTETTTMQNAGQYQSRRTEQRQGGKMDKNAGRGKNADETKVQLREETLQPVKQSAQAGEVELHKVVHEKEQQIPVNLKHEEVTIERHAVDRPAQPGEIGDMKDEVIRVPVYQEQAELQKQARVREEVDINKRTVEEQQTLTGTTRHEHLEAQQSGDVNVQGAEGITGGNTGTRTGGRWEDVMPAYRSKWEQSPNRSGRWEDYEPSYRYGWEAANNPQYQGQSWNQIEPNVRRDWESRNPKTPWDRAATAIRETWAEVTNRPGQTQPYDSEYNQR